MTATVLVTRGAGQNASLVRGLQSAGCCVKAVPVITTVPVLGREKAMAEWWQSGEIDWMLVTSVNTVYYLAEWQKRYGLGVPSGLKTAAVGPKTKQALEQEGFQVELMPEQYKAVSLAESAGRVIGRRENVLLPQSAQAADTLYRSLTAQGLSVWVWHLYTTVPEEKNESVLQTTLKHREVDVLMAASPSSVDALYRLAGAYRQELLAVPVVAIGPSTGRAARESGFKYVYEAEIHSVEGMIEKTKEII
ncbi:uroporphyrinogen-III synthase [Marinococcus luteus]|uniref:Uroporphyrinogen-III synthase n=1 Tax=Marinococcus luteus TaxID=1122204 RepID=A0A1H2VJC0_9BACI|nr:uroporphyrinogen-III synthase [Marinococcus luteus]SDW68044.1 uroporphyrinogen-III synthase [Marinococcus luteus]